MPTRDLYIITGKSSWRAGYDIAEKWIYDDLQEAEDARDNWIENGSTTEYKIFKLEEVQ